MKRYQITAFAVMGLGCLLMAGCGNESQKLYEQASRDLEAGSYEYALEEYASAVNAGVNPALSYRGMGIANMRLGNYEAAEENFTSALSAEKLKKTVAKDLYTYRATVRFKRGLYEEAMADCQILAQDYPMDADTYFLTGNVALAMDAYDEASMNFEKAYGEDSSYTRAIQIYEVYLDQDMEADGTRYLEAVLTTEPKSAEDYCDRGRAYYYMNDYANAQKELTEAVNRDSSEAVLLLGEVYMEQGDYSNARAMYQQFVNIMLDSSEKNLTPARGYNGIALCDMAEGNYDAALENIASGITFAEGDEMQSLLFNEIVAYERKLDFVTAKEKAESYLEIYPEDEQAVKELAFLNSRI